MKIGNIAMLWGLLLGIAGVAGANDGAIAYGGSPALLTGHPSVSMVSEVVKMTISAQTVTVDCQFVFKNHGKKTQVRMGFPDEGGGSSDPDEEYGDDEWKNKPAKTTFNWFKSWVDGTPAKTELIRSNRAGLFWHAKNVAFAAGQTRRIRDLYNVDTGGQIAPAGSGYYKQTSYVLHTGKSWHGKINRSEVIVIFALPLQAKKLQPTWYRYNDETYLKVDWKSVKGGKVMYHGPTTATANGLTMRFVRTNWEPQEKDDIWLAFDYQGPQQKPASAKRPYIEEYPFNRTLQKSDLKGRGAKELKLIRNAIYARHGRPFKDKELADFFGAQKWYRKDPQWKDSYDDTKLTKLEKQNAEFLLKNTSDS